MKIDRPQGPQAASSLPLPKMKRGLKGFFRDVIAEMKKVHWPTRQEATRLSGVVLAVCAMVIVILYLLTLVFGALFDVFFRGGLGGG